MVNDSGGFGALQNVKPNTFLPLYIPMVESINRSDVNYTDQIKREYVEDFVFQAAFSLVYFIIFTLGIFGNVLVVYVVFANRHMRTVTNIFIVNLAVSDIMLCGLAVPFTPLYTFTGRWIFGSFFCHIVPYAQGTSVYTSTLTLTSIAIDRFFVIIYPFQPRMTVWTTAQIIATIWIFSLVSTLPYGIYMVKNEVNGKDFCEELWPLESIRKLFGAITAILQFVLPFLIIAFCYVRVWLKLNDRARCKPGTSTKNARREEVERERKSRTNRMLIAMVAIFGVSWLPLTAINFMNDFYQQTTSWQHYYLSFFSAHAVAMSSTCYNPFLYAWLNENFRKEFKQVLPCWRDNVAYRAARIDSSQSRRGRVGGYRLERTCNGNDTCQETLLPTSVILPSGRTTATTDFTGLDLVDGLMMGDQEDNQDAVEVMLVAYTQDDGTSERCGATQQNSV
ncbi:prolactin-releasing peptide receptor-like [Daktulosphaira vitifoliae]|uniref:prolactin-releasing peptide receptor-like n=1 Tax=Daktulosphaira vitifoliae TaxID=58002 RepID=UPI0021AAED42|nr:prolactin-releasing peptide receptor-like [Daktulosphaira vitifoliae]XP_050534384.1 prolactin-releasing peptide receptor-like [Daktulosphaira vitifoliae]